jgi:hypothetical protein
MVVTWPSWSPSRGVSNGGAQRMREKKRRGKEGRGGLRVNTRSEGTDGCCKVGRERDGRGVQRLRFSSMRFGSMNTIQRYGIFFFFEI